MADEPAITYEGPHADQFSKDDETTRKLYSLPGDRLRVDPSVRLSGVDVEEVAKNLGQEVLTVSKTILETEQGSVYVTPRYEFEGIEGRFSTKMFQHEKGEGGAHSMVAMRDGEMWMVPLDENNEGKILAPDAVAREVVGFTGKMQDSIHPEGMTGMKEEVASNKDAVMLADVYYRNVVAFGDKTGPVEIVGMPMAYGEPDKAQLDGSRGLIDEAVFEKRIGEVARDADNVLRKGGLETADGREPYEVTEMVDALQARTTTPSPRNSGAVLDAAEAMLGMMYDRSLSRGKEFDDLSRSVEAAGKAGDEVLRSRYSDIGLEPAAAKDIESLARRHDAAMDAGDTKTESTPSRPSAASIGAASAAMMQQGR